MRFFRAIAPVLVLAAVLAGAAVPSHAPARAQTQVTVDVGDFWYCDSSFEEGICQTTITAGDTVLWDLGSAINSHTVTACGDSCDNPTSSPLFDSGNVAPGGTYTYTFNQPGTFLYYCTIHPTLMFGRIVVQPGAQQPATQTPAAQQPGTSTPAGSTPLSPLPASGQGPGDGASAIWWVVFGALTGGGALLALVGAARYGRQNRG